MSIRTSNYFPFRKMGTLLWIFPFFFFYSGFNPDKPSAFGEIHNRIFLPRCANSACHGGAFEPDLRTPYAAFNSLVYYPVTKNNTAGEFKYRVIPYDTSGSVLHERLTNCCFVNKDDRMPQSRIGSGLSPIDINLISEWILSGAPDLLGNVSEKPVSPPVIENSFDVFDEHGIQLTDSLHREGNKSFGSIRLPYGRIFTFRFKAKDDETAADKLTGAKIVMSEGAGNLQPRKQIEGTKGEAGWEFILDTRQFEKGSTWFFQFTICDENCSVFPDEKAPFYIRQTWSFKIITGKTK